MGGRIAQGKTVMEIHNIDYNPYIDIVGTAHFTRRSLKEAYEAVETLRPEDVALELDWRRFLRLNTACLNCPKRGVCGGLCEFIGVSDALGNVDANIWLIDMTEQEMRRRIRRTMTVSERSRLGAPMRSHEAEDPLWLWERGFKERVIKDSKRRMEDGRRRFPSVWRVLIDERNALMAARLASIASRSLDKDGEKRLLAFVGAAHEEGIRELLRSPPRIKEGLKRYSLSFTEPTLIRRVAVS